MYVYVPNLTLNPIHLLGFFMRDISTSPYRHPSILSISIPCLSISCRLSLGLFPLGPLYGVVNRPGRLGVLRTESICPSTSVVPIRLLTFSLRRVNSILVVAPEQSGYKDYIMNNLDLLRHVDLIQIPHLSLLA